MFLHADGSIKPGNLRVRFGEVEARGIALTPAGRTSTTAWLPKPIAACRSLTVQSAPTRPAVFGKRIFHAPSVNWRQDRAYFTFTLDAEAAAARKSPDRFRCVNSSPKASRSPTPSSTKVSCRVRPQESSNRTSPIKLPRTRRRTTNYDIDRMSSIVGKTVLDPNDLYRQQQDASVAELADALNIEITRDSAVLDSAR